MSNPWEVESVSDASEWEVAEQWEVETEEPESGVGAAFGAGVDKLQETAYRAVKGFTDTGENPEDYEKGSVGRAVGETIGQGGTLSQWAQDGIDRNVEEQKSYEPTVKSYKDIYDEDSPVLGTASNLASYTGELVSNSAPYMLAAAHPASAFAMGGGLSEEAYSKQPEGEKNAARAVTSGMGQMALERIGLKGSTGAIFDTVKKEGLRNTVKRIRKGEFAEVYKRPDSALEFSRRVLVGATGEGVTEVGQDVLAQWGAGKDLSQIDYSNMDENFFGGFAAGGAIRTGSEAFQVASAWKDKAQPIATNGIESLVEAGTPMDEAIEQVRDQLIESAKKQGLSEVAAEASAARILKEEYDIDHEVFTPVADDVASRRAAMNERLAQQRVDAGIGEVQQALSQDNASPTVNDLLNEAQNFNDPFASELEQQQAFEQNQNLKEYQQSITDEVNSRPLAIEDKGIIFSGETKFDEQPVINETDASNTEAESVEDIELPTVPEPVKDPEPPLINQESDNNAPSNEGVVVSEPKTIEEAFENPEYDFSYEGLSNVGRKNAREAVARIKTVEKEQDSETKTRRIEATKRAIDKARVPDEIKGKLNKLLDIASADKSNDIDAKAHEAATSPLNDTPEPTQAQKEANNYKLGRIKHSGFDIGIENPQGSDRKGIDSNGKEWSVKMNHHYGDITGTKGADGDAIDVFVKPSTESGDKVFVVNQVDTKSNKFDEHKVMLGFDTLAEAKEAYLSNYSKGWNGIGSIAETSLDDFKAWTASGDTTKAFKQTESNSQPLYGEGVERITHVTKKGKELTGIVDNSLTRDEAKAIDPFSFRKGKDGWFIREDRIAEHNEKLSGQKGEPVKAEIKPELESKTPLESEPEVSNKPEPEVVTTLDDVDFVHGKIARHTATKKSVIASNIRDVSNSIRNDMLAGDDFPTAFDKQFKKNELTANAYADFLDDALESKPKTKTVEKPQVKADTETKQVTEDKPNETTASDNQAKRSGQQTRVSENESGRVGSEHSRTSQNDREGNGSAATSGRGQARSSKPSVKNNPETSSLNLDDVDNIANGTESERVRTNIEAIRLLKQIQSEDRQATLEEKKVLAQYVGWGGLKDVFNSSTKKKFAKEAHAELKKLLTDTEYNGIRKSVTTAFYTSKDIVKAMWSGVEAFGLGNKPMNVVEPSVGSGNFIGWQPEGMRKNSHWSATEIDPVTGNIAKLVYDEADIQVKGYQDAKFKQGVFSLAIGNPPFGAFTISDKSFKDISGLSIHNYMIAKSSKLLHENGLMMMVITNRFLDTKNANHKELSKTMDFVGAVRLPNTAFKSNAGTEVTTDVVIFRKLKTGEKATNTVWTDTDGQVNGVRINKWFEKNPQYVLGEVSDQGTLYAQEKELTVNPTAEHADIGKSLTKAINDLAKDVDLSVTNETLDKVGGEVTLTESDLPIGGMMLNDEGNVVLREDDDIEGNASLKTVTPETVWTENGKHLANIKDLGKDKVKLAEYAKAHLMNASGSFKSTFGSKPFKALKAYLDGDMAFGKFRAETLNGLKTASLGPVKFKKLKAMLGIRNTALSLLKAEKQGLSNIEALRAQLNKEYDALAAMGTKKKPESIEKNLGLLNGNLDIESGLDSVSKSTGKVTKHAIFEKRMIQPYKAPEKANSVDDAVNFSMQEKGFVDTQYISELMGISKAEANKKLTGGSKPYLLQDPDTGKQVFIDDYLSGNVKAKLEAAKSAGLDKNVELLKTVQPKDKTVDQVKPSIRATWMDESIFKSFLADLGIDAKVSVSRSVGTIKLLSARQGEASTLANQFKNDAGLSISQLFEHAASGKALVIYDTLPNKQRVKNEKATKTANVLVNKLGETFETWANSNPDIKSQIAKNFNDRVNTHVTRKYNGRLYLQTVGQNPELNLRKTQLDGALRMIQSPNVLLDHTVGAGKTFTAITGVMERRRLGLSQKPLVVVPNHIIGSFTADFYKLYPGARVLTVSDKQMSAKNRKKFFSQMATGDYDAIVIGHSHLKRLPNDIQATESVFNEKIAELREALEKAKKEKQEAGGRGASVSQMEQSIIALEKKLQDKKDALEKNEDGIGFSFSDLGVDYMVIDEAHEFKNLMYATRGDRVVGMNDPKGSDKALDLLIKSRGVQGLENGGVTFMTGTPVSNSLVEVYTMMYYLGHKMLKENHISHYDAFSGSFIDTQVALEYTPTGTVQERRVLKGLNSVKELITKYKQFADVITQKDMVEIYAQDVEEQNRIKGESKTTRFPIPNVANGGRQLVSAKASETQKEFNDYLIARMEGIQAITGRDARKEYAKFDNPLWVLSDARKSSLDVRLVDPTLPADPTGKVKMAAEGIRGIYDKWNAEKGTQLVFSDMGVPTKSAAANAKKNLVKLGAYIMEEKKARNYVNAAIKQGDSGYSDTLSELVQLVRSNNDIDAEKAEAAEELIRDLESETLTADTGFSVYDELKAELIDSGIPEKEIAFIHDYDTPIKKDALFDAVNEGEIRVLIGSSSKMGAGTNVQKRLVALHHMDAPWRPSDMEQREGRIIRQGNSFYERAAAIGKPESFEVTINAYSTEGSSDPVMWQILERKASAIEQFRNGEIDEFVEDKNSDADSYANFKAQTTGNPIYKMKLSSDSDLLALETDFTAKSLEYDGAKRIVNGYEKNKGQLNRVIKTLDNAKLNTLDVESFGQQTTDAAVKYESDAQEFTDRFEAWNELSATDKKKVKKPVKPTLKPIYKYNNSYSKALDKDLLAPLAEKLKGNMRMGDDVSQEIKLGDNVTLGISVEPYLLGENTMSVESYIKVGGHNLILAQTKDVKSVVGSSKIVSSLSPKVVKAKIEGVLQEAQYQLKALESDYKAAKPILDNKPDPKQLEAEKDTNLWLEVETEIADIKDKLRRSEKPNRFIDRERIRNVKAATNDVTVKPENISFGSKDYQTVGLTLNTTKGKVKPAYDDKGNYVHLIGRYSLDDTETLNIVDVKSQPDSIPAQDYAFLDKLKKEPETDKDVAFSIDAPSTVKGTGREKGMHIDAATKIAQEFMDEYNGGIKIDIRVAENQEDHYGQENTSDKVGVIQGAFHRRGRYVSIVSSNLHSTADAREVLRHEILGHYGLEVLGSEAKADILNQIIESKNERSLSKYWKDVQNNDYYKTLPIEAQAEEVFAHVIQSGRGKYQKMYDAIITWLRGALKKVGLAKYPATTSELHRLADTIAKKIKEGAEPDLSYLQPSTGTSFSRKSNSIHIADESKIDSGIRKIQDKFRRLKLVQRELNNVNESNDTYLAEEAFHGKVSEDLRQMEVEHVDKIANLMAQYELSQDEVDLYLIAKHAEERNAYIDSINPELEGKGSGMSNEDAQRILDKAIIEGKRLKLENVADHVYAMLAETRQRMVDAGLEPQDAIDTWQEQYQYYVPLKGYAADDAKSQGGKKFGTGKGFNVKGRETMKALGRRSLAESPLLHTISDTSRAIIRSRKNEVGNTFLKMVNDNPDNDFWQVFTEEKPDLKRGTRKVNGTTQVEMVPMTGFEMAKDVDNYFTTKVDGVEQYIKIKDPLLLKAMNNLGVEQTNVITQTLGKVTRTLSALVTTWNPEFMFTNAARDVQTAIYNVLAETQVADGKAKGTDKLVKKMVLSIPKAVKTLRQGFRNNNFDGEWGSYLKEFLESGAKTGWVNQKDINELGKELKGAIAAASNTKTGKARKTFNTITDFVSDYNDIAENATRFSVYYHARKQGISKKQAASLAKNLTVNFNRKGEWGNTVNSLYMFANASVQGTANMLRAVATPRDATKSRLNPHRYNLTQKLALGTVFATVAAANLMRVIGGDDEDGEPFYDKIPDHVKANNFVVMLGEGKDYISIPMPYGYNIFANFGHAIDDISRGKSVAKVASRLMLTATSVFSPIGSSDSSNIETGLLKTITPTVGKPVVELVANENFFGSNIYPEQAGYKTKVTDGHLGDARTWQWLSDMTTWLNDNTGGSKYREGGISIAPQSIQHILQFMGGGLFQTASRSASFVAKGVGGEEIDRRDIPFSRRFYKAVDPRVNIGNFYDDISVLDAYAMEYKVMPASERSAFKAKFNYQLKLQKYASLIEKRLRSLNQKKRKIQASKLEDDKKERLIEKIDNKKIELSLDYSSKKRELGIKDL